ncbi:putative lipid II flippase FtsW [Candidatus Giovannonibacteria bacterium]|nr:putative lipid II flippase FtsW [Candidatus Giovannonibacteria bacterium]
MSAVRSYDNVFFILSSLLVIAGLFILASSSMGISISQFGQPYYFFLHQILFGFIPGVILFYIALKIPYKFWRKWSLPLFLLSMGLMILVFIPQFGFYHGGAKRWLDLGPISFQPSELLKFSFVIYLAAWLETRSKEVSSFKFGLLPFAIMSGLIAIFLIMQPDIGTLLVLLASATALFFIRGGDLYQMGALVLIAAVILGALAIYEPYRMERINVFLHPEADPQNSGYQINQALIAAGSGGVWGRGFALSRQKFSYLPEPIGDSIFAIVAEEMGFVGSIALVALFILFFLRGILISKNAPDLFGKLLGAGLILLIIFQAFINMASILGMMPLTGIPLSFVSYGGSALAIMMLQLGIILNISKNRA